MHQRTLHELAKVAAGLVLGDFLCGLWLNASGLLPQTLLGVSWTSDMLVPWLLFDVALFIMLVHYGWHIGKVPTLRSKTFFQLIGILFGVVALAHLVRVFTGADLLIAGWTAPLWPSWVGTIAAAYLSYMSFHLATTQKK